LIVPSPTPAEGFAIVGTYASKVVHDDLLFPGAIETRKQSIRSPPRSAIW
jgi:hypothetical protein